MLEYKGLNKNMKQGEMYQMIQIQEIKLFNLLETKVRPRELGDLYLKLCSGSNFTTNISYCSIGRIVVA